MAIIRTVGDGGAAFPRPIGNDGDQHERETNNAQDGMTLRDYYAGEALSGLMARPDGMVAHRLAPESVAKYCFEIADAMVAEAMK